MFAHQSVRHSNKAATRTIPHDDSDESKATITQQPVAEKRKTKREALANYLKTNEKAKASSRGHFTRTSGTASRNGPNEIVRQSSKSSLTSQ